MKKIILIGLCILLMGCDTNICSLGWDNETHFCNEYHNIEEKHIENKSYWQRIFENDEEYMDCCMGKTFEEIPINDTYCISEIVYIQDCKWDKGKDETWKEHCFTTPTYKEECYLKNNT